MAPTAWTVSRDERTGASTACIAGLPGLSFSSNSDFTTVLAGRSSSAFAAALSSSVAAVLVPKRSERTPLDESNKRTYQIIGG